MSNTDVTLHSYSPEETFTIGRNLAADLCRGQTVALVGDLGSGKTCLIQGICEGLGIREQVTSPTFILIQEYVGRDCSGSRTPVYHFDLYRLRTPEDLVNLGWDDYLDRKGICLIEWADRAGGLLPEGTITIHIEEQNPRERVLKLSAGGQDLKIGANP